MLKPIVRLAVPTILIASALLLRPAAHAQGPPSGPGAPAPGMPAPLPSDTAAPARDSLMNVVLKSIAGKESMAAESVFKNIKVLTGMPAGRVPRVMNFGYGRSLGVGCGHCHVIGEWAKDDKKQKQVARDMWAMMRTINDTLLTRIQNLESKEGKRPTVNCTTCHRGQVKPALDLGH